MTTETAAVARLAIKKRGAPGKQRSRRFLVKLDLGDGSTRTCWVIVSRAGVEVRPYRSRKGHWFLPLRQAAEAVARAAQREAAHVRMYGGAAELVVTGPVVVTGPMEAT
jgi:hypothetical protein